MSKNLTEAIDFSGIDEGEESAHPFLVADAFSSKDPRGTSIGSSPEPITIFYNSKVNVYYLPYDKAKNIIRWVEKNSVKVKTSAREDGIQRLPSSVLDNLKRDMPLTRKKSLETFLLRRKERMRLAYSQATSPHGSSNGIVHQHQ